VKDRGEFERRVLPHLDAAYNLARWLMRDERAAEDAVQEAALRAFRYFGSLRGDEAKPWLLGIVRNTCFAMLERRRNSMELNSADSGVDIDQIEQADPTSDPAVSFLRQDERARVNAAIRALPHHLREVLVLREIEGLEYAEIARVADIPVGTVMSRLSRAREKLRAELLQAGVRGKE